MSEQQTEQPQPSPLDGWDSAQIVSRFLPDPTGGPFNSIAEAQARGHDTVNPVTGSFQVAVVVDGHPVVIVEEQASQVKHLVNASKQASGQNQGGS